MRIWSSHHVQTPLTDCYSVGSCFRGKIQLSTLTFYLTMASEKHPKVTDSNESEFGRFTNLLDRLLAVPHSELKAALDAEKQQKKAAKRDLSSDHVSGEKG